jgi:hypothetical protein
MEATFNRYELGGASVRLALIAGARRVIAARDALNRINVFPVPDGDTGTNLAFTFQALISGLQKLKGVGVDAVLTRAANDTIDGARGNSGAIMAQFFSSLAQSLRGHRRVSMEELTGAVEVAAKASRMALAAPREGTILSVIAGFAHGLKARIRQQRACLRSMFETGLEQARAALKRTPLELKVLKQAGVVDAGGQGFVDFLEGVECFIRQGRRALDEVVSEPLVEADFSAVHADCQEHHRYCTECVIEGHELAPERVRDAISELTLDSLVLAGAGERMKVHAHTDTPAALFEALSPLGSILGRKIDDMHMQARAQRANAHVHIASDSAADLPESFVEQHSIHLVPVRVMFAEEEYLDRITLPHGELYRRLRHERSQVRTSQPPAGDFKRLFSTLHSTGKSVVSVQVSSALSGTWQAARSAAERVASDIHVVDSRQAACGQGLLVMLAAALANAGIEAEAIVKRLEQAREHVRTFALIDDLGFGIHGGRIPAWIGRVCRWFSWQVVIRTDAAGRIRPWRVVRSGGQAAGRFLMLVRKQLKAGLRYRALVGHCGALEQGTWLAQALRELPHIVSLDLVEAGTAIGAHAGPGTLVVSIIPSDYFPS